MPPRTRGIDISNAPRRRPTGSERRRRVQLREVEPAVDRDPVEHPQHDRDETEEVFKGVPGGLSIDLYCGVFTTMLQRRYGWER